MIIFTTRNKCSSMWQRNYSFDFNLAQGQVNNDSNIMHISKKMSTFLFIFLHQPLYYLTVESCTPPVHDLNTDKHNYLDLGISISLNYVATLCGFLNNWRTAWLPFIDHRDFPSQEINRLVKIYMQIWHERYDDSIIHLSEFKERRTMYVYVPAVAWIQKIGKYFYICNPFKR